jgi:hypothetical protein
MSDSVTIRFVKGEDKSPALSCYHGGEDWLGVLPAYYQELVAHIANRDPRLRMPLDRMEPEYVMVSFIRWLGVMKYFGNGNNPWDFEDDFQLLDEVKDGRSWNGNWDFDLQTGKLQKTLKGQKDLIKEKLKNEGRK